MLNIILAQFIGLFGGISVAYFMHFFVDNTITTNAEVSKFLHLPVLSSIPLLSQHNATSSKSSQYQKSLFQLYRNLNKTPNHATGKMIQFIGPCKREGKSSVIQELAQLSTQEFNNTVLIVDYNQDQSHNQNGNGKKTKSNGESHLPFKTLTPNYDSSEIKRNKKKNPIYTMNIFSDKSIYLNGFTTHLDEYVNKLKSDFDLVLVDCPDQLNDSLNQVKYSSKMDGVVIVVESEKTRYQVAQEIQDTVARQGGNVLGVVLNKRRYHIPQFLYNRLFQ